MPVRIIPCLDIKDGRVVKGVHFKDLKDSGDPIEAAKAYGGEGAHEIFLLNISPKAENRQAALELVKRVSREINIPLGFGGGIVTLDDFRDFINAGAKKISVGSAAIKNPSLIKNAAQALGRAGVVVAIDAKRVRDSWSLFIDGGRTDTKKDVVEWAMEVESLGAGEILLTSMDRDGTKEGYDIELLRAVTDKVSIPVIASGGAGRKEDFLRAIEEGGASAVLAASLFHFKELEIGELKEYLLKNGVTV